MEKVIAKDEEQKKFNRKMSFVFYIFVFAIICGMIFHFYSNLQGSADVETTAIREDLDLSDGKFKNLSKKNQFLYKVILSQEMNIQEGKDNKREYFIRLSEIPFSENIAFETKEDVENSLDLIFDDSFWNVINVLKTNLSFETSFNKVDKVECRVLYYAFDNYQDSIIVFYLYENGHASFIVE